MKQKEKGSKNILSGIKIIFSKKKNRIITIIVAAFIIVALLIFMILHKKDAKFTLNEIYDLYPEEVRELYSNIVEISCTGDLHLNDIELNAAETSVDNLNKNDLLDYLFSNIDKNEGLNDKIKLNFIKKKQNELLNTKIDLTKAINNYQYGDYTYTVDGPKIVRKKAECKTDIKYVSFLYGYSWNKELLSMDVNIAYLKDGILYDLKDNKLGAYDGDLSKLFELTKTTSYYRFNYIKDNNNLKLDSVKWMNKN